MGQLVTDFDDYCNYLKFKVKICENQISYYLGWVTQFFAFCNERAVVR